MRAPLCRALPVHVDPRGTRARFADGVGATRDDILVDFVQGPRTTH